jgi:hypothetical protein
MGPRSQPLSLLRQAYSAECLSPESKSCLQAPLNFLVTDPGLEEIQFDSRRDEQLFAESLVTILVSMNPTTEMLKPGTPAARKVRNPSLFHPAKPMGTLPRATRSPLDLILRHTESHALAMFLMAFLLFLCSGVFWLSHKQPEEAPPFPLPKQAEPIILANLRHPPIALRHSVGVRSFP